MHITFFRNFILNHLPENISPWDTLYPRIVNVLSFILPLYFGHKLLFLNLIIMSEHVAKHSSDMFVIPTRGELEIMRKCNVVQYI